MQCNVIQYKSTQCNLICNVIDSVIDNVIHRLM